MKKKYKLCYLENLENFCYTLYFADTEPENVWGDDWDDVPYEDNAGIPYCTEKEGDAPISFKRVVLSCWLVRTSYTRHHTCSGYSVEEINKKYTSWLVFDDTPIFAGYDYDDFIALVQKAKDDGVDCRLYIEKE